MRLATRTGTATFGVISVSLALGWILAGCESQQAQNVRVTATKAPEPAVKPQFTSTPSISQQEYDARIAARTGRRNISRFSQVSMFGELPGIAKTPAEAQPGKSLQQQTFATEGECFDPRVSADGKWLVFASTQHTLKPEIYIKPVQSTAITQITNNPAGDVQPAINPNASRIAFCSDRTGNWDLFIIDTDGKNLQQLTDDPAPEMHPSFSPDGKKIAYCRYNVQTKQWEIWLLDLSNPGQRKFIGAGLFPSFSPAESKIVYQRACLRGSQLFSIWVIGLAGDDQPSAPTQIVSSPDRALIGPQWSADGKRIVYCSVRPGNGDDASREAQVWIIEAVGQGRMPITDPGIGSFSPTWAPDGRIFFCANRGDCENIWSVVPVIVKAPADTARAPISPSTHREASRETATPYHATDSDAGPASEAVSVLPNQPVRLKTDNQPLAAEGED